VLLLLAFSHATLFVLAWTQSLVCSLWSLAITFLISFIVFVVVAVINVLAVVVLNIIVVVVGVSFIGICFDASTKKKLGQLNLQFIQFTLNYRNWLFGSSTSYGKCFGNGLGLFLWS